MNALCETPKLLLLTRIHRHAGLRLLVTGGFDTAVRLWNEVVTARPVAVLRGHSSTVLDVVLYQPRGQVFSYSRDAVSPIEYTFSCTTLWDNRSYIFPFLLVEAALPAKGPPRLLVACKDYLALLRLAGGRGDDAAAAGREGAGREVRHGRRAAPITAALYNPGLGQVATGRRDSSLAVWEAATGRACFTIHGAHGREALTCMAVDSSGRRLITGARNGTVKVRHGDSWTRSCVCLCDVYVKADMAWKSEGVHKSDILAVCPCPALGVIATASYDGEVVVWRVETQGPALCLSYVCVLWFRVAPPVDHLLFLQRRAADRQWRNRAVLVSSQGGSLYFWSLSGHTQPHGECVCVCVCVLGERPPPLLHRWRAHQGALVCTEVLELPQGLFILTASTDGSARLWTSTGTPVGCFGQGVQWDVAHPAYYDPRRQRCQAGMFLSKSGN
uniref:Uncharacterized protein n=1 Tax=Gadus morhua TaxID=8049 RepID=A0A8C5AGN3_GADMO